MTETKITFAEAFARFVVQEMGKEYGEANFDRFVAEANRSSIPGDFNNAVAQVMASVQRGQEIGTDNAHVQTASRLLEKEFTNPKLATYALLYGSAISLTKNWIGGSKELMRVGQRESEVQGRAKTLRGVLDTLLDTVPAYIAEDIRSDPKYLQLIRNQQEIESDLRAISLETAQVASVVAKIREGAVIKCGQVVVIEQSVQDRSVKQKIGDMVIGRNVSGNDLEGIRVEMEGYFSDSMKHSRMVLLSRSQK